MSVEICIKELEAQVDSIIRVVEEQGKEIRILKGKVDALTGSKFARDL